MSSWTFLTNHAQVLLCIARNNQLTAKEIAGLVGITERAVQRILDDLEAGDYISRSREGRRNVYQIHAEQPMRHPAQQGHAISELLDLLSPRRASPSPLRSANCVYLREPAESPDQRRTTNPRLIMVARRSSFVARTHSPYR